MRTTVTLDADTESAVRQQMAERGVSFKVALNDAIRRGVGQRRSVVFRTTVRSMGSPTRSLDRALQISAGLEDADLTGRPQ